MIVMYRGKKIFHHFPSDECFCNTSCSQWCTLSQFEKILKRQRDIHCQSTKALHNDSGTDILIVYTIALVILYKYLQENTFFFSSTNCTFQIRFALWTWIYKNGGMHIYSIRRGIGGWFFFSSYLYFVCWYSQIYHVLLDGLQVLSWQRRPWVLRAPGICDFLTAATGPWPHGLVVINQTK